MIVAQLPRVSLPYSHLKGMVGLSASTSTFSTFFLLSTLRLVVRMLGRATSNLKPPAALMGWNLALRYAERSCGECREGGSGCEGGGWLLRETVV